MAAQLSDVEFDRMQVKLKAVASWGIAIKHKNVGAKEYNERIVGARECRLSE